LARSCSYNEEKEQKKDKKKKKARKKKVGGAGGEKVELQPPLLGARAFFQTLSTSEGSCASREA
jgi:hypothetical protein